MKMWQMILLLSAISVISVFSVVASSNEERVINGAEPLVKAENNCGQCTAGNVGQTCCVQYGRGANVRTCGASGWSTPTACTSGLCNGVGAGTTCS
jgi:hypothetical protein